MNAPHKRDFSTNERLPRIALLAAVIGLLSTLAAFVLLSLIHLFTNLFFFQQFSFADHSPANNTLGAWVIAVPVIGGLIVGLMARFGSRRFAATAFRKRSRRSCSARAACRRRSRSSSRCRPAS